MPRTNSNHSTAALRVMATVVPCNLEDYMTQKKSGRHQAVPLVYARVLGPPLADPAVKIRLGQISHGFCSYSQAIISVTVARGELYAAVRPHCNFSSKATSRAAKDVSHFPGQPLYTTYNFDIRALEVCPKDSGFRRAQSLV